MTCHTVLPMHEILILCRAPKYIFMSEYLTVQRQPESFILLHTGETDSASFERSLLFSIPEWTLINQKTTNTHQKGTGPINGLFSLRQNYIHSASTFYHFCATIPVKQPKYGIDFIKPVTGKQNLTLLNTVNEEIVSRNGISLAPPVLALTAQISRQPWR